MRATGSAFRVEVEGHTGSRGAAGGRCGHGAVRGWGSLKTAGFHFSPRVESAVGTERNLIHVG